MYKADGKTDKSYGKDMEQGETGLKHESKERMLSNSMRVVQVNITRGIDPRTRC